MKVQILVDNPNSWITTYAEKLRAQINELQDWHAVLIHEHQQVESGDILCLLSCEKIFKNLDLNKHNLVVHESALTLGKGWSPLTWQVLEGLNNIPITLFEAADTVDSGVIYAQHDIVLEGHELLPEIKHLQGLSTCKLILDFLEKYPDIGGEEQSGDSTYYPRRTANDSELNMDLSIGEQFNLLRICDNDRYPAFFTKNGIKYKIKIEKE